MDKQKALKLLLGRVDKSELSGEVLLFTDAHSWRKHLKRFYSPPQYFGAIMILYTSSTTSLISCRIGVILTVLPQLQNLPTMSELSKSWSLIYLCFTIPAALSSIYKEFVFRSLEMDVWYD